MLHARLHIVAVLSLLLSGCGGKPPAAPATLPATQASLLAPPQHVPAVRATCRPPLGWAAEPLKKTNKSEHQVWISPTGDTAYGVLNVRHLLMALASNERILSEFLDGMRATEGAAELVEKQNDPAIAGGRGGIRFIARGGKYTVRANLTSAGRDAWIWYAGTLSGAPVRDDELRTAEIARDQTVVGAAAATP